MAERKSFPTSGIFRCSGLASSYYMTPDDERRYRYIKPADYAQRSSVIADCWIVDAWGAVNPGTSVSPVPISRAAIGRRVG